MKDYNDTMSYIVKKYCAIKDIISIYNWGDPSTPGISDIDIVFVLKDNTSKSLPLLRRSFYFLNSKARYLVRHPFVFIGKNSFENIRQVYPNANLNLLYGQNISIKNLSSDEAHQFEIALLNDIIIRHYPRDFLEQAVSRKINARDTMLRLNSLKYTAKILESITKKRNAEWNNSLSLVEKLRKNWFEFNDFEMLASLKQKAVEITMQMTEEFREFLVRSNQVEIISSGNEEVTYSGMKNKSKFVKNWDKEKALHEMSKHVKDDRVYQSILPIELSAQLIEYSKNKGPISDYVRNNIGIEEGLSYRLKHKNIVVQRINILNSQAELAFHIKHSDFAAFFDFGYCNKSGINNLILGRLRRWVR